MRISDWSSDVCSSDLVARHAGKQLGADLPLDLLALMRQQPLAAEAGAGGLYFLRLAPWSSSRSTESERLSLVPTTLPYWITSSSSPPRPAPRPRSPPAPLPSAKPARNRTDPPPFR